MITRFKVENFLSIKEPVELDLKAAAIKELDDENVAFIKNHKILKSLSLYGANSSGKSNILKALIFVKKFIQNSLRNSINDEIIDVESFKLNTRTEVQPSKFEISVLIDNEEYRYGFSVDYNAIHQEWLYQKGVTKDYKCFERSFNSFDIDEKRFIEGKGLEDKTRPNVLFLSLIAQFNGSISTKLVKWVNDFKYFDDTNNSYHQRITTKLLEKDEFKNTIKKLLTSSDLGFADIEVQRVNFLELSNISPELKNLLSFDPKNTGPSVMTSHFKYDENGRFVKKVMFSLNKSESLGTQKFFALAGPIVEALINGRVFIIDEFESRLHPLLCMSIIKLFNSKLNNPNNAQLIFVTHNTTFLSKNLLRRDQIVLAKKDKFGATTTETLLEIGARNDEAYERKYLHGAYKALPELPDEFNLFSN
jgi:AAA15 family ATPase/GTPase